MFQPEFLAAFLIGFFGSLHCVGMCGPIALVTPSLFPGTLGRILSGIIYNSGRTITYAGLGILAGTLGKGFAMFQWQQMVSIILGVLIIFSAVLPGVFRKVQMGKIGTKATSLIKKNLSSFLKQRSFMGILSIGLVNGLLPCGLVYIGLAGSIDMSRPTDGALFMAFFGLGTFPIMTGIYLIGNNLKGSFKNKLSRILPYFIFLMGLIFILRGAGLGIPYVSPSMEPHEGDVNCHVPSHRHD